MAWLLEYADLISAGFGLIGAVILGMPAWAAVVSKRYFESFQKFAAKATGDEASRKAMRGIRDHVVAAQLGDSRGALLANAFGFGFLLLSFIFLGVAAVARQHAG